MSANELLFMFILFGCAVVRPFALKRCVGVYTPKEMGTFSGVWSMIAVIAIYPVYGSLLNEGMEIAFASPLLLVLGTLKGVVLWGCSNLSHALRQVSNSTAVYVGPLALGGLAILNSFQGEELSQLQWVSVILLFSLGVVFTLKGHLHKLPTKYKWIFLMLVLLSCLPGVFDHRVISETNWYTLLFLAGMGMLFTSLISGVKLQDMHYTITKKEGLIAGVVWGGTEIVILSLLVTHIPVTMAVMAMMLSVPVVMISSSVLWGEGKWQQQAAFGALTYIAVIPMMLL